MSSLQSQQDIIKAYMTWLDTRDSAPRWVYSFVENTEIEKDQFYDFFTDLNELENEIWLKVLQDTLAVLDNDPSYQSFTLRERLLAFYYTLLEVMNDHRQALSVILSRPKLPGVSPSYLKTARVQFEAFITQLIHEGVQSGDQSREAGRRRCQTGGGGEVVLAFDRHRRDVELGPQHLQAAADLGVIRRLAVEDDLIRFAGAYGGGGGE